MFGHSEVYISFTIYLQHLYPLPALEILYFSLAYTFGKVPAVTYYCLVWSTVAYLPLNLWSYDGYDDLYRLQYNLQLRI